MRIVGTSKIVETVEGFCDLVAEESGQPVEACYQCGKCTAGCPLAPAMDLKPNQVIRAVQLGLKDLLLGCNGIWHCSGCETCFTRCPRDISAMKINKALTRLCMVAGEKPKDHAVATFHQAFMESVGRWGRGHEVEILSLTKLRDAGQRFKDIGLGAALFEKGRLALLPSWVRRSREVRRVLEADRQRAEELKKAEE